MTAKSILITLDAAEFDSYLFDAFDRALKRNPITAPPPAAVPEPDRYIDQEAVADIFGVSTVTVWSWEKAGLLKSYRIGNLKRFKYSEVMQSPKLIEREQKKGGQKR